MTGTSRHRAARHASAILLAATLAALAPLPARGVALRPDVRDALAADGRLAGLVAGERTLAKRGLNQPLTRPQYPAAPEWAAGAAGDAVEQRAAPGLRQVGMTIPVLLVDFSDNPAAAHGPEGPIWFETLLFSEGLVTTGSMREYYTETSYGTFELDGQSSGWHRMPETYAYYVDGRRGTGGTYPRNARGLAEDAVRLADAQDPSLDWSQFDRTGPEGVPDGIVDGLIIVHSGPGFETTGNPNDIHSHFWTVIDEELVVDGVRVTTYIVCPQDGNIGVFAHEFGHNLGLPDLYETDAGAISTGVGVWAIMGYGSWLSASGSTIGLDAGTRPSHFCAWSKLQLGFATAIGVTSNQTAMVLRPVEAEPDLVRLWTNGSASPEYFLVENRAPFGFDEGLPFQSTSWGGLLVWHIDENQPTNDDTNHLLVALEQADGRRDIENADFRYGNGDSTDPFSLGGEFTATSQPSSRDYAGNDTQVRITSIQPVADAVYTADLVVETTPAIRRRDVLIDDVATGNGDGGLDASERATLDLVLENVGLGTGDLTVALASGDPRVTVSGGPVAVGALDADATVTLEDRFALELGALDRDPYAVELTLSYASSGYAGTETLLLAAGDALGYQSNVEDAGDTADWSHRAGRSGYRDDWHVSTRRARSGAASWRCAPGSLPTYEDLTDALLETPLIVLDGQSRLFFWQWLAVEDESPTRAWDGGLVEISMNGGTWQPIEPVDGYPYTIVRNQASPIANRGAFSGQRDWHRIEFDLAGFEGAARLRFRFGSDGSVTDEGWYVDDVIVASPAEPYTVAFLTPEVDASGQVMVSWDVEELLGPYNGTGFNVYRRLTSADFPLNSSIAGRPATAPTSDYVKLNATPLPMSESFVDADVAAAERFDYLLEDLRQGVPRTYGPRSVYIGGVGPAPRLAAVVPNPHNPASGPMTIRVVVPGVAADRPTDVRLSIYSAPGRLVRRLVDAQLAPGKREFHWDGRSDAGAGVSSGVYYLRMEADGRVATRRLTVLR